MVNVAIIDDGVIFSQWTGMELHKRVKRGIICIR